MKEKVLSLVTAAVLLASLGLSACGGGEENKGVYRYPQEGDTVSFTQDGVSRTATAYPFSAAVSDEHFADHYPLAETSRELSLTTAESTEDGILFTGHCGVDAALCGVYVRYQGYYLLNGGAQELFGVCLKDIPSGTYEATAFAIGEDNTLLLGGDYLLFDAEHSLSQAPMTLGEFHIKYGSAFSREDAVVNKSGKFLAGYGNDVLGKDRTFSISAELGEGESGVVFGLGNSSAERYFDSEVPYYYFSSDGTTARLSRIRMGTELLEEKSFPLGEGEHQFSVKRTEESYVCSADGTELFTVQSETTGFVGVRADGRSAVFRNAAMEASALEEFKGFAEEQLRSLTALTRYTVRDLNDNAKGAVDAGSFDYSSEGEIAQAISTGNAALQAAKTREEAYEALTASFSSLESAVLGRFRTDALSSLNDLVVGWADLLHTEFDREDYPELSLACESMTGTLVTDPLALYDGRWWIPEFYRIRSLLGYAETALEGAQTVGGAAAAYEDYFVDLLKAMCQKNGDTYYYYYRNNFSQTYSNAPYWWYVCTYTMQLAPYLYAGTNQDFANTRPSEFRLTSFLYNPADPAYSRDIGTIVESYNRWISVDISVENPEHRWS